MTIKVIHVNVSITMQGVTSITQKGQVVIPKSIRDQFKLQPSDKIRFSVKGNKIIAEPIPSVDDMYGIIKTKKVLSKQDMKKTIREAVVAKYANSS